MTGAARCGILKVSGRGASPLASRRGKFAGAAVEQGAGRKVIRKSQGFCEKFGGTDFSGK